jgi:hypothetical protein
MYSGYGCSFRHLLNKWLIYFIQTYKRDSHNPLRCTSSHRTTGRTSTAWLKERISQHYAMAKDIETDKGKDSILPPPPKKSFLDRASNKLARTIARVRTGLCGPYLKRIRKDRNEPASDRCWWCGQWRMSRTHVFLRCTHLMLEKARIDIWDLPDENGRKGQRPKSVG